MGMRALLGLRALVIAAFTAAIAFGIFLPVYTDESGWRFHERAGFDGVDKMFSELCGPNTLAQPPFFMMPARWYSAFFNGAFADPFYLRLSGVLYALGFGVLMFLLVRRLAAGTRERSALAMTGFGLIAFANLPLIMVMSRPEQPLILTAIGAVIVACLPWRENGWDRLPPAMDAASAWARTGIVLALTAVALSYHLKSIFLVPLFLACVLLASWGRKSIVPRIAGGLAVAAMAASAALYWIERFRCPDDPVLRAAYAGNNISSSIVQAGSVSEALESLGALFSNISVFGYVRLATPEAAPLSGWLAYDQIDGATSYKWFLALTLAWGATMAIALVSLVVSAGRSAMRRRVDVRIVLALFVLAAVLGWGSTQLIRNVYEAGFVLPLLALAIVLAMSCIPEKGWLRTLAEVAAVLVALAAIVSPVLIARIWWPSLDHARQQTAYIDRQPFSTPLFGYDEVRGQIMATARMCRIPEPEKARAVGVDEITYFAYMKSHLPQHRLGLFQIWTGALEDPVAYLKERNSDGVIVGCHMLPADLRARAKQNGEFCCLGPDEW
ncbi:hypothetical protein GCM10011371_18930 [Novosphingobium marinum]|uniref:Glycosyltransferase RgtA/B/C/D-like domain-containing protein n=1 Tax=Novosphingobium marinum TaxID=1514948 RepID=A0A7Z0BTH5_9SPHN|nr:hypothetical protein [Novosphingobium marinum]NYH96006.1 hypothetical protein [Novosphingobium marinum]GGC31686.1 hypothetical protein GCM10011371_18930 [Novosphingobium marinum]